MIASTLPRRTHRTRKSGTLAAKAPSLPELTVSIVRTDGSLERPATLADPRAAFIAAFNRDCSQFGLHAELEQCVGCGQPAVIEALCPACIRKHREKLQAE